jgi:hypothetical protein
MYVCIMKKKLKMQINRPHGRRRSISVEQLDDETSLIMAALRIEVHHRSELLRSEPMQLRIIQDLFNDAETLNDTLSSEQAIALSAVKHIYIYIYN